MVDLIKEDLEFKNNRGNPLSALQQVCVFTSYLGSGAVQWFTATPAGVKKSTANYAIRDVMKCNVVALLPIQQKRTLFKT